MSRDRKGYRTGIQERILKLVFESRQLGLPYITTEQMKQELGLGDVGRDVAFYNNMQELLRKDLVIRPDVDSTRGKFTMTDEVFEELKTKFGKIPVKRRPMCHHLEKMPNSQVKCKPIGTVQGSPGSTCSVVLVTVCDKEGNYSVEEVPVCPGYCNSKSTDFTVKESKYRILSKEYGEVTKKIFEETDVSFEQLTFKPELPQELLR
ncbi:hypothetical protein A3K72_01645 [Candidatus Woesearchaeota archaeon RBG_13_36_6]|nr:MAG: hypothetical protein A3K72_01645 [Candidatus Woesearchaeota archaeon RBG_13_36_6]